MRLASVLLAVSAAVAMSAPAIACPPPPPPPMAPTPPAGTSEADVRALSDAWNQAHWSLDAEQVRERALKQQADLFDKADGMVLARLDRRGRTSGYPADVSFMNNMPLVVMKPLRWIRGDGGRDEFQLAESYGVMSCGFAPADAALRGNEGAVFLVYLDGSELSQDKVLFVLPVGKVIEQRALALLTTR